MDEFNLDSTLVITSIKGFLETKCYLVLRSANLVGQCAEDLCLDVVPVLVEGEGGGAPVVGQPLLRAPHLQDVTQVGCQNLAPDIF